VLRCSLGRVESEVKAGNVQQSTLTAMEIRAGHLVAILGDNTLAERLTRVDVDRYIDARREGGISEHTIAKELCVLRSAMKAAKERGLYRGDVSSVVPEKWKRGYKARERWLPPDELDDLLSALLGDRAAQVAFMIAVAAEKVAADNALASDITRDRQGNIVEVRVRGQKNEYRDRPVAVTQPWQYTLLEYALQRAGGAAYARRLAAEHTGPGPAPQWPYLFAPWASGSYVRDLHTACRQVGCIRSGCAAQRKARAKSWTKSPCTNPKRCESMAIAPVSANDLRRTFAQWMRRVGVPAELVFPLMGHIDSTQVERVYGVLDPDALRRRLLAHAPVGASAADVQQHGSPEGDLAAQTAAAVAAFSPGNSARDSGFEPLTFGSGGHQHPGLTDRHYKWKEPRVEESAADVQHDDDVKREGRTG
jgi:integrase